MSVAHYIRNAESHAGTILGIVKQLAAGMGGVEKRKEDGEKRSVGNAPLGLRVGLRLSELYERAGEMDQVKKQYAKNKKPLKTVAETGAAG
ncbi:hypothetical protein FRC07_009027 [Ceratobasidium sp. 392]|nr:hypothetical protein FRC07_009027 [Ceratobasidium sp. 392]